VPVGEGAAAQVEGEVGVGGYEAFGDFLEGS
jgi:hypothetical protein